MLKQIAGIGLMFSLAGIVSSPTTILADRQDALAVASVKTVPLVVPANSSIGQHSRLSMNFRKTLAVARAVNAAESIAEARRVVEDSGARLCVRDRHFAR